MIRTSICNEENCSVKAGTDGGNSDIGVLADFADDEVDPRCTSEMLEEIRRINDMGFRSDYSDDEYTPQWEYEFQQTIAPHVDISDTNFPNGEHYEFVDRRVTEAVTSRTGSDGDISGDVGSKLFGRPVTDSMTAQAGSYTDFPSGEHYEFVNRRVTEAVTSRTGSDKDISGDVDTKLFDRPVKETATAWAERDSHGPSDEYWKNSSRPVTEAMTEMAGNDANISRDANSDLFDQLVREWMTAGAESGEPQRGQYYGCQIPDCKCDGRVVIMEWDSNDRTERNDSEYESTVDRANRLYVDSHNYDMPEEMIPRTYDPPLRRNRRRRYEVRKEEEVDMDEPIPADSDRVIQTVNEQPEDSC